MGKREMYQGMRRRGGRLVILADGEELDIAESLKIVRHSPTGFECGYGGSGPAQTALAILLDHTGDPEFADRHHQAFKWQFIAPAPRFGFLIFAERIDAWIEDLRKADRP